MDQDPSMHIRRKRSWRRAKRIIIISILIIGGGTIVLWGLDALLNGDTSFGIGYR
jgi:hypothetical protein